MEDKIMEWLLSKWFLTLLGMLGVFQILMKVRKHRLYINWPWFWVLVPLIAFVILVVFSMVLAYISVAWL
jgi:hypothetical protein